MVESSLVFRLGPWCPHRHRLHLSRHGQVAQGMACSLTIFYAPMAGWFHEGDGWGAPMHLTYDWLVVLEIAVNCLVNMFGWLVTTNQI